MLVLSREPGQTIVITAPGGERLTVVQLGVKCHKRQRVKIGVNAPSSFTVHRQEIQDLIDKDPPSAKVSRKTDTTGVGAA